MRIVLLLFLLYSFNIECHKSPITFYITHNVQPNTPELNVDIEQFSSVDVPSGIYRLVTHNGQSHKYVKMVIDGKIQRNFGNYICFYVKDGVGGYIRIACIDITSGEHDISLRL